MSAETAAPCRHLGASPDAVIQKTVETILSIGSDEDFLISRGLTCDEYKAALPSAIEALRGSKIASNSDRRQFLTSIFEAMLQRKIISDLAMPSYGDDTVYRLSVPDFGDVAIIQKGCPDGAHSSVRWSVPEWARETYLWWLCSSLNHEPGEHVAKGVNRLRQRFFGEARDTIDGVIFHNGLCGGPHRPCPKSPHAVDIKGQMVPPPCIYVMPDREEGATSWNWERRTTRAFPAILLSLFEIGGSSACYTSDVGFQRRGRGLKTTITSRFGPARSTAFRT